jgi:hypothetical protein
MVPTASVFVERQHKKPQVSGFGKAPVSSVNDPSPSTPVTAGSSDPIQSLPVKAISYHAAPSQAAVTPMQLAATTVQTVTPTTSAPPLLSGALSTILPADRFTTASARGSQFVHEQPASTAGTAQPRMQISHVRNDVTVPSLEVGAPNVDPRAKWTAGNGSQRPTRGNGNQ